MMRIRLLLLISPALLLSACGNRSMPSSDALVLDPSAPVVASPMTAGLPPGTTAGRALPR
jgi:hypothetical protein